VEREREREGEEEEREARGKKGKGREGRLARRRDVGPRLTVRDERALRWLAEQRAASLPQVARLLGDLGGHEPGERRTRHLVGRWEELGLATRTSVWHGEPAVVWLTTQGARLVGLTRWRAPSLGTLRHTLAVSEVRLRLAPSGAGRRWVCEADLRRHSSGPGVHVADAGVLDPTDGTWLAVEVELTPHGRRRTADTMRTLLAEPGPDGRPRWRRVLYLCSPRAMPGVVTARGDLLAAQQERVLVRELAS